MLPKSKKIVISGWANMAPLGEIDNFFQFFLTFLLSGGMIEIQVLSDSSQNNRNYSKFSYSCPQYDEFSPKLIEIIKRCSKSQ